IEYSKKQLQYIDNPKVKSILKSQIKEMEKVRNSFKNVTVNGELKNGKFMSALFTFIYVTILKGKSLHSITGTNAFKTDWKQLQTTKSIF
ncbi:hypothetical protein V6O07_14905, partial [Arthrospira platensis SPKY2]